MWVCVCAAWRTDACVHFIVGGEGDGAAYTAGVKVWLLSVLLWCCEGWARRLDDCAA